VRLPGITGTLSVVCVFIFASITELGLPEAIFIGLASVLIQSCRKPKARPRPVQIAFSSAAVTLAVATAEWLWRVPLDLGWPLGIPSRLLLAAFGFYLTSTIAIAAVIGLTEQKSIRKVWTQSYRWSLP